MKTIDLTKRKLDLAGVLRLAEKEPILISSSTGQEFMVSKADDFDSEVEALRESARFQAFLDERMKTGKRIPLAKIEKDISRSLRKNKTQQ